MFFLFLVPALSLASEPSRDWENYCAGVLALLIEDPVTRLKSSAEEVLPLHERESVILGDWEDLKDTDRAKEVNRDIGNSYLRTIRVQTAHLREFLQYLDGEPGANRDLIKQKLQELDAFALLLPEDISNWEIDGREAYLNGRPESRFKIHSQTEDLKERWVRLNMEGVPVLNILKSSRSQKPLRTDTEKALQTYVVDGLEFLVRQSALAHRQEHHLALDPFFSFVLPAYSKVHLVGNFSADVSVKVGPYYPVFEALVSELGSNAIQASIRRGVFPYGAGVSFQKVGNATEIILSDFGSSDEFSDHKGVGNASQSPHRDGIGIGRFRAQTMARFLGYELSYRPKPDGSGSEVRILIPGE